MSKVEFNLLLFASSLSFSSFSVDNLFPCSVTVANGDIFDGEANMGDSTVFSKDYKGLLDLASYLEIRVFIPNPMVFMTLDSVLELLKWFPG